MKTIVCIKRVPDTEARIKIGGDNSSIDAAGIKYVISPYEEFALEAALRMKEAKGEGEVAVVTVGEASSAEQLRSALAMGADRAVLLKGQPSVDGLANVAALSHPAGLALNTGTTILLISDSFEGRVRAVDLARGTIVTLMGTGTTQFTGDGLPAGETALLGPVGISISPEDMLYVSDSGHRVVWRLGLSAF